MKKIIIIPLVLGGLFIILSAVVFAYCFRNRQAATAPLAATSTVPLVDNLAPDIAASSTEATTTPAPEETSPALIAATSSAVAPAKADSPQKGGVMIPATAPTLATTTAAKVGGSTGLANPASTNCKEKGGTLQIKTNGGGGQYGLCYFEDNYACEEWALFRGECPVGGRRTTGYDTEAQRYCAWLGGQTLAVANAVCTFKDGSTCPDDALYNGTCSPKTGKIE
jgi:putative hemolysin